MLTIGDIQKYHSKHNISIIDRAYDPIVEYEQLPKSISQILKRNICAILPPTDAQTWPVIASGRNFMIAYGKNKLPKISFWKSKGREGDREV